MKKRQLSPKEASAAGSNGGTIVLLLLVLAAIGLVGWYAFFSAIPRPPAPAVNAGGQK